MPRDPLDSLIKVRRLACDEAVRRLAGALADEDRAERTAHALERTIAEEMVAASRFDGSDAMVEAFGAWLPKARQQAQSARRTLADRQAETVRVRAELTACRTALETAETLQEQRRIAALEAREKRETRDLEDRASQSTAFTEPRTDEP